MKTLSTLYQKVLGHPFVYDHVRPFVAGVDLGPLYRMFDEPARRSIVDIGCGTGDALRHIEGFERYLGVDTDPVAIDHARRRWQGKESARFEQRELRAEDIAELAPTGVVLSGVLHHLPNDAAAEVLRLAAASPRLVQVLTTDIVFVPGKLFNNVLAMLDRGRYCRDPDAYADLARRAGLDVDKGFVMGAGPTTERVVYWTMSLRPRAS